MWHSQEGHLIEEIGQISAGEARGAHGDGLQVYLVRQLLVFGMHLKDRCTPL